MSSQVPEGYKQSDAGMIPADWPVSSVGQEFSIQLGKMLDAAKNTGDFKPYLANRSVQWNSFDLDDLPLMAMSDSDIEKFRLKRGDLIVCEGGEIGRAAIWNDQIEECYYQKALHRLRALRDYSPRLMVAFLKYWTDSNLLSNFVSQTSIAHLTKEKFSQVPLPVPHPEEQKAIASTLSDMDELLASLDRLIAKKRDLKQATMQQLLTGKKRLLESKSKAKFKDTDIGQIPEEWDLCEVSEVTEAHKQGYYTKDAYVDNGIRLVRITDLHNPEIDYEAMPMLHISSRDFEQYKISRGDFLFARSGAIGRYGIVEDDINAVFGSYIIRFNFKEERVLNNFFGYLFETQIVWRQLLSITQGSSNININANNIKALKIPLPDLEEQATIAQILGDIDTELTALQTRRAKTQALKQAMMQQLLTGQTRLITPSTAHA